MNHAELLARVDHTVLSPTATWDEIRTACEQAVTHRTASVCIPPRYVARAAQQIGNSVKICTVIGFPNGYSTPQSKVFEAERAVHAGADEIDMVIPLGAVKAGAWDEILDEIRAVKSACGRILKVIVEACLLTQAEKEELCRLVSRSGADFIKTSTGFSTGGATLEDVALFRRLCAPDLRIKAAGGIRTLEQAYAFLDAGADRIGSSALVGLVERAAQ